MKYSPIKHFSHPHQLILKSTNTPYKCNGCKELGLKECYECEYEDCNFHLHVECADSSYTNQPFCRKCAFKFYEEAPGLGARYCDACGKDVLGFMYQCSHDKAHDLHPCCLKLQRTIKGEGIELELKNKVPSKCLKCHSKEIRRGVKGWSYVSTCGEYCFHVACVKDMFLEKWKKGYLLKEGEGGDNVEVSSCLEMQSVGARCCHKAGEGMWRRKGNMWIKTAKLVLQLIISVIFGDPISVVAALVESLVSS